MNDKIIIGVTKSNTRFEYYPSWIAGTDSHIQIALLAADYSNEYLLTSCDALVLTGGTDLHPSTYQSRNLQYPHAPVSGWDEARDHFEQRLFREAVSRKIPILAICRGMQLVNVALGGTLIADLEANGKNNHRRNEISDGEHLIQVIQGTQLAAIAGANQVIINSAHHQAVELLANELAISAVSPDDVIEAVEWREPENHGPLLAVQWHPERMDSSLDSKLSDAIRNWILQQAAIFQSNKN
ncbi:MAG: gamma-glutamyl-gamma-aminobutyrate hydrolase family protein [Sediminibacterium sp.]|nr:gamma-glutamyl-gamma-aminobutyrate hydrolase family protein [Sediminibacterium sp.]